MKSKKFLFMMFAGSFLYSISSFAQIDLGENLSDSDLKQLTKFFGVLTTFHQTNGPSELGDVWGLDVGVQVSANGAKTFNNVVESKGGDSDLPVFPYGYPVIRWGAPYGIGGGVGFFPKLNFSDVSIETWALAFNWSYGYFFELPVSADVRFHFSSLKFKGDTTISSVPYEAAMGFKTYGMTFSSGKKWEWLLFAVEPYAGIGWHLSDGDFSQSAGIPGFIVASENSFLEPSYHIQVGVDLNLVKYLQLVFEYNYINNVHGLSVFFGASI